jgi:small GTP-binding protein
MTGARSIVLQLTAPGTAAISTIRLTGSLVERFLQTHFTQPVAAGELRHGKLVDGGRIVDDPVVVRSVDGASVDVHVHGSAYLTRAVLELAERFGFTEIDGHELPLPREAVVHLGAGFKHGSAGGIDPLEAEVLRHLPMAMTLEAVQALLSQPKLWRAGIDRDFKELIQDESLYWLLHPPRVAIVGNANVGKSTIANRLFSEERSIVADVPGTTRDWVGEHANLDGLSVVLMDTPGLRATDDRTEQRAIDASETVVADADAVLWVVDASSREEVDWNRVTTRVKRQMVAVNKWDRRGGDAESRVHELAHRFGPDRVIRTVATQNLGMDELRRAIRAMFGCEPIERRAARWWSRAQQERLRSLSDSDFRDRERMIAALLSIAQ